MNNTKKYRTQAGMTLVTSLMMLLVMTILGVTAIRLSSVDLLIANNYQHQLSVYQAAKSANSTNSNLYNLYTWITVKQDPADISEKEVVSKTGVADLDIQYPCRGRGDLASSIGPNAPPCNLYMFSIDSRIKGTGAKDTHYQGAGKEVPNTTKSSTLK